MNSPETASESRICGRCGSVIDPEDCFELVDGKPVDPDRATAFVCRIEHVAAWAMRQPGWGSGAYAEHHVTLRRHRSGTVAEYPFETLAALRSWALAGGQWADTSA